MTTRSTNTHERVYRLDAATEQRMTWIAHVVRHSLGLSPGDARPTFIVRRAIECFACYLDDILTNDLVTRGGETLTPEMRLRFEAGSVRRHGRGEDLKLWPGDLQVIPVRPLSEILREKQARMPRPIDQLLLLKEMKHDHEEANDEEGNAHAGNGNTHSTGSAGR